MEHSRSWEANRSEQKLISQSIPLRENSDNMIYFTNFVEFSLAEAKYLFG
jgi:hypothetical protein